jgi:type II secretory pathway pseudopilin PulG
MRMKNLKHSLKHRAQASLALHEVLLVVAVSAILSGIAIIAISPGKNLGDMRNSQRSTDVGTILNGVYQYSLDKNGVLPSGISTTATEICATGASSCTGLVDLTALTTGGKYLVSIPKDPRCGTGVVCSTNGTGYKIVKDANGRVTVNAPSAEQNKTISVTK